MIVYLLLPVKRTIILLIDTEVAGVMIDWKLALKIDAIGSTFSKNLVVDRRELVGGDR